MPIEINGIMDNATIHNESVYSVFECSANNQISENDISEKKDYFVCDACGANFRQKNQLRLHCESKCGTIRCFECKQCNSMFMNRNTLNTHTLIHNGDKKYLCNFCGSSFLSRGQLKIHERSHTKEKPYKCSYCSKAFAHRESLVTHSSLHTGVKPYQCECCKSQFSCIGNLIKHRRIRPKTCGLPEYKNVKCAPRARTKVLPCVTLDEQIPEICAYSETFEKISKTTYNSKQLNCPHESPEDSVEKLNNIHDLNTISNDVSLETIQDSNTVELSVLNKENNNPPTELNAEMVFLTVEKDCLAQEQQRTINGSVVHFDDFSGDCRTSEQLLDAKTDEQKETNEVDTLEEFECEVCSKRFKREKLLIKHLDSKHNIECDFIEKETFQGCYCRKQYSSKNALNKHKRNHGLNGELTKTEHNDRLKCNYCRKVFNNIDCKTAHIRKLHKSHTDVVKKRQFVCSKCGKRYILLAALSDHEQGDCGRSPLYNCDFPMCGKSLQSLGSLKIHQLIHSGDLPFACSVCSKKFRTQGQVKVHGRCHSGEKPFKCEHCTKAFAHRESLLTHISLHTGIKRFSCKGCGARFSCISNLQAHRRTHTGTCGQLPLDTKPQS